MQAAQDIPLWKPVKMKNGRVIYSFNEGNNPIDNDADLKYTPKTPGSLYFKCHVRHRSLGTLFGEGFKKDRRVVYVSFFVLYYMMTNLHQNPKKKEGFAEGHVNLNCIIPPANTPDFIKFIEEKVPKITKLPHGGINFYVRLENGEKCQAKTATQVGAGAWDTLRNYYIVGKKAYSARPSRHLNFGLGQTMIIKVLDIRLDLFTRRISSDMDIVRSWVQDMIDEVNSTKKPNDKAWRLAQNGTPQVGGSWDLWNPEEHGYIAVSVDPFDLYTTYVHQDDWNAYMAWLVTPNPNGSQDVPVIRAFPGEDLAVFRTLLDELAHSDYRVLNLADPKEVKEQFGLSQVDIDHAEEIVREHNLSKGRQMGEEAVKKTYAGIIAMWENAKVNGVGSLTNFITADKMDASVSMRNGVFSQSDVMANVSASVLAQTLNWETCKLKTTFSPAEWLHLSAFSYGGFGDVHEWITSQTPLNLVFGTSEANSLMTRHEMAWQRLFRAEQDMVDCHRVLGGQGKQNVDARLLIALNDPDARIVYDSLNQNGNFELNSLQLGSARVARIAKDPTTTSTDTERVPQIPGVAGASIDTMVLLAHFYPFLAYSIKYEVVVDTYSGLLGGSGVGGRTYFYPFQRSWFHTAESRLDDALFRELERFAWEDLSDDVLSLEANDVVDEGLDLNEEGIEIPDINYGRHVDNKKLLLTPKVRKKMEKIKKDRRDEEVGKNQKSLWKKAEKLYGDKTGKTVVKQVELEEDESEEDDGEFDAIHGTLEAGGGYEPGE